MPAFLLRTRSGMSGVFPLYLGMIAALFLLGEGGLSHLRYVLYRRTLTGKVVDTEPHTAAKGRRDRLIVEYTCDGQTFRVRSFFPYARPAYRIGEEIPVRVSEKDSGRAMLPCDRKQAAYELAGGALLLLVSITALSILRIPG